MSSVLHASKRYEKIYDKTYSIQTDTCHQMKDKDVIEKLRAEIEETKKTFENAKVADQEEKQASIRKVASLDTCHIIRSDPRSDCYSN